MNLCGVKAARTPHTRALRASDLFHWSHTVRSNGPLRTLETIRYNLLARHDGEVA